MTFASEADFEEALIQVLTNKGWEKTVIKHPTEADLLKTGLIFCLKIIIRLTALITVR